MAAILDFVERRIGNGDELTVVWLHGLGADGHDFAPIVPELELRIGTRFLFPHAPVRPVTINGGLRMRAWYDLYGFGADSPEDDSGLADSADRVQALIAAETAGTQSPVVLGGFSQGGAVALHLALREPSRIAGAVALSAYLPLMARAASGARADALPVFMAHGSEDPIISLRLAEQSRDVLRSLGCAVEWHVYDMGHAVCPDELRALAEWLAARPAA